MRTAGRPKFAILNGVAAILLLAQLVLTAGHLHDLRARHLEPGVTLTANATPNRPIPTSPADEHDHAACPFCWIQAAGVSLLLPNPPSLPHRHPEATLLPFPREPQRHPSTGIAAFRPRAPPAKAPALIG